MTSILDETMQSLRTSPAFTVAVLLSLSTAALIGLMVVLMQLQPGFLGMAHFTDPRHRVHDLTFGLLFAVTGVGLLAQFRRPSDNIAGIVMALIPWVGLSLAAVVAGDLFRVMVINPSRSVAVVAILTALLHPAGRDFFRSFRLSRINWPMLVLLVMAAVPLLGLAFTNIGLQQTIPDDHAAMGHYGFMAAFGFTVIGVGLLASLRPDGWRVPAWVAGLLPALLGLTSIMLPDNSSSLGLVWALVAIVWGLGFVAVADRTRNIGLAAGDTRVSDAREPTTGTAPWVTGLRIIALVPILLVFVNTITTLTGVSAPGLPGGHTPPAGVDGPPPSGDPGGHRPPVQH